MPVGLESTESYYCYKILHIWNLRSAELKRNLKSFPIYGDAFDYWDT